jgi:transcriptional regulator with XRE-family HTH domain
MKKNYRQDFRRESVKILQAMQVPNQQIANHLGVSVNTIVRWKKGKNSPQPYQFERLKKLANGKLISTEESASTEHPASNAEIIRMLGRLEGRFDTWVANMDKNFAGLEKRVERLEQILKQRD